MSWFLGVWILLAQEKAETRVCAMDKVVEGTWCPKCGHLQPKSSNDVDEHETSECDGKLVTVRLCDRRDVAIYRCAAHPKEVGRKPEKCGTCGKERVQERGWVARIAYRCGECKAEGAAASEVVHRKDCKKPEPVAFCTESGNPGHDDLSETEGKVIDLIVRTLQVPREKVTEAASLEKDLGADELDRVELVMAIEDALQVTISNDDAVGFLTVGDILRYVRKLKR